MNRKFFILTLACSYSVVCAPITQTSKPASSTIVVQTGYQASPDENWVFEFKNKTKNPLYIQLVQAPKTFGQQESLLPLADLEFSKDGKTVAHDPITSIAPSKGKDEKDHTYYRVAGFDPRQNLYLYIWDKKGNPVQIRALTNPNLIATFSDDPNRKKIFVSFENTLLENNKLRAQDGIKGKSQSGVDLTGNIKNEKIFVTKKRAFAS